MASAVEIRAEATRARRLARTQSDPALVRSFIAYAEAREAEAAHLAGADQTMSRAVTL